MDNEENIISEFDNQITLLYKAALAGLIKDTPEAVRFVMTEPYTGLDYPFDHFTYKDQIVYFYAYDFIYDQIENQGKTLAEVYSKVDRKNITKSDFVFLYYYSIGQYTRPDQNLADETAKAFDKIQEYMAKDKFINQKLFREIQYTEWNKRRADEVGANNIVLDRIFDSQRQLEESSTINIPRTEFEKTRSFLQMRPLMASSNSTPNLGNLLDIFKDSVVSYLVPYISYYDGTTTYYKIYQGDEFNNLSGVGKKPSLKMILPSDNVVLEANQIYLTVWMGSTKKVITKPTHDSYTSAIYDLETNTLDVRITLKRWKKDTQNVIIDRIRQSLASLDIPDKNIHEVRLSGYFYFLPSQPFIDYIFLHQVTNDPIFSSYLYIDEKIKAYPEKTHLTVNYRSLVSDTGEPSALSASLVRSSDVIGNKPTILVSIKRSISKDVVDEFSKILAALLSIHYQKEDQTLKLYKELDALEKIVIKPKDTAKSETRWSLLKRLAPDIFSEGYASVVCQGPFQPLIIDESQVEGWKKKLFRDKNGDMSDRTVIKFPAPHEEHLHEPIYLVCPTDARPYPQIKLNIDYDEEEGGFQYLPCCAKEHDVNGLFGFYYEGKPVKVKTQKRIAVKGIEKIVSPDGTGNLPVSLQTIAKLITDDSEMIFVRRGMINDNNSLIHAVLWAFNPSYRQAPIELKKQIADSFRSSLDQKIDPNLLKQELYDLTDEQIISGLTNPDTFFDPALFYRALEEFFLINIFVFSQKDEKVELELPRHKLFHSRAYRPERKTILIYKHMGAKADALTHPHCELIVRQRKVVTKSRKKDALDKEYLSGEAEVKFIYDILNATHSTYTWTDFTMIENMYYNNDYFWITTQILGQPKAQMIDNMGKARAAITDKGAAFFLPTQPANLPLYQGNEYPLTNSSVILDQLGDPIAVTKDSSETHTTGLWYSLNLDKVYAFYIPIIPTTELLEYDLGPNNYFLDARQTSITTRIANLRRQLDLLLQVFRWLQYLSKTDAETFMFDYGRIYEGEVDDSANFYDLSLLPYLFPVVDTVQQAIAVLEPLVPTLFSEGTIIFYSEKFFYYILDYLEKSTTHKLPFRLKNYYVSGEIFKPKENTIILVGQNSFNKWYETELHTTEKSFVALDKLDSGLNLLTDPYIYTENNRFYLIQNVKDNSLNRSLVVAASWFDKKLNRGYNVPESTEILQIPTQYYDINTSGNLEAIEPILKGNFVNILRYQNNVFAAILPLNEQ